MTEPSVNGQYASPIRIICLVLGLFTLLLYLPVRQHGFVRLDDPDYVVANPVVQSGLTTAGVAWACTSFHASNWHPLTWLSHMLDVQLFGAELGAHHVVSVLIHTLNTLLFFLVFNRMTGQVWPSAFVAALFAWHPLHVESVAWLSERKDVLSTLCFALTLWAYHRHAKSHHNLSRLTVISLFSSRDSWLVVAFFALGLMAKPMLVTLPFLLLLLDYWPLRRLAGPAPWQQVFPRLLLEKAPLLILSAASSVVTFLAQREEAVISLESLPFGFRLGNALLSGVAYIFKMLWPAKLAVIYPFPTELNLLAVVSGAALLGGISAGVFLNRRRHPYLLVGWFWFLGTLVPVIGLVQVGTQAMADRYTYIPLLGLFLMIAFGSRELAGVFRISRTIIAVAAGSILAGCLYLTHQQLPHWKNSETLFRHALAVTKDNAGAHEGLGYALAAQGRNQEAAEQFQIALRLDPAMPDAHNDFAIVLEALDREGEAMAHYREAVRLGPRKPVFRHNLGILLVRLGHYDEAISGYREALRLEPDNSRTHYLLAKALQAQGRNREAVEHFKTALELNPADIDSAFLLCRMLASNSDPGIRNGTAAVHWGKQVAQLSNGEQPEAFDALAMAYAETGQFDLAIQTITQGLALLPEGQTNHLRIAMQERLQLYRAGRPFRDVRTTSASVPP